MSTLGKRATENIAYAHRSVGRFMKLLLLLLLLAQMYLGLYGIPHVPLI